jgi:phage shock protein PspC (stress-responsive transcriptional regulator)
MIDQQVNSSQRATPGRLYRSRHDRKLAGVCGGLGQYLNLDPVLARLAFVVLTLMSGIGLLAYIVMAIVIPERPVGDEEPVNANLAITPIPGEVLGYALAGLGLLLLAGNFGLARIFGGWDNLWPLLLVGLGVLLLVKRRRD